MKKAVVTTFPLKQYDLCAREMLRTFDMYWPEDIDLYISLDCVPEEDLRRIDYEINQMFKSKRQYYLCNEFSNDQHQFLARNTDAGNNYRFHVCRFSYKVFALGMCEKHLTDTDHLIWLDADVITHKPITHSLLDMLMPEQGASYLGRIDAPHSECGFVAYNLNSGGREIIKEMVGYYLTDKVLTLPGWTDCDVFDAVMKDKPGKNLSEGIPGWHVWPLSPLGALMAHHKGNRKLEIAQQKKSAHTLPVRNGAVATEQMQIKTKNCLPNDKICDNIRENLTLINHWVEYVKPHDEPIVIASAGEGLAYSDIKPWADKGTKIVCVKHAIERLKSWGIKPWACVLLDPRPHVEAFVKKPDKDVIYFVASMVDPSVVRTLLDNECKVVGYHAFVGAGEEKLLKNGEFLVCGGSATATRSIGLLAECLGFKEFHCYGYDLCHYERPDPKAKDAEGQPKYIEITLGAKTWGNKDAKRTFWTEGQFLAQANELRDLYKMKNAFKINLYGQGMAAWQQLHFEQHAKWMEQHNAKIESKRNHSPSLNDWEHAIKS